MLDSGIVQKGAALIEHALDQDRNTFAGAARHALDQVRGTPADAAHALDQVLQGMHLIRGTWDWQQSQQQHQQGQAGLLHKGPSHEPAQQDGGDGWASPLTWKGEAGSEASLSEGEGLLDCCGISAIRRPPVRTPDCKPWSLKVEARCLAASGANLLWEPFCQGGSHSVSGANGFEKPLIL
eukprot:1161052-Pelagomonas_calceolata.AAC.1